MSNATHPTATALIDLRHRYHRQTAALIRSTPWSIDRQEQLDDVERTYRAERQAILSALGPATRWRVLQELNRRRGGANSCVIPA